MEGDAQIDLVKSRLQKKNSVVHDALPWLLCFEEECVGGGVIFIIRRWFPCVFLIRISSPLNQVIWFAANTFEMDCQPIEDAGEMWQKLLSDYVLLIKTGLRHVHINGLWLRQERVCICCGRRPPAPSRVISMRYAPAAGGLSKRNRGQGLSLTDCNRSRQTAGRACAAWPPMLTLRWKENPRTPTRWIAIAPLIQVERIRCRKGSPGSMQGRVVSLYTVVPSF